MKKIVSLIIVLVTMLSYCICPMAASAEMASGKCGENITWTLDNQGTLTFQGAGRMVDYGALGNGKMPPWYKYRDNIIRVYIGENITSIGACAFYECTQLKKIDLPSSLLDIMGSAFMSCHSLKRIILPPNIESVRSGAFWWCSNLTSVFIPRNMPSLDVVTFVNNEQLRIYYEGNEVEFKNIAGEETFNADILSGGNVKYDTNEMIFFNSSVEDALAPFVYVNQNLLDFEQPPVIRDGRTLVPLRTIFEEIGATVDWDDSTKTVTSKLGSITIQLTIGSNLLYKNGTAVALDVPAQLINGYTMVPARAIAEAFGADVDWDGDTQTVYITTKGNTYSVNSVPQITYDGYNANFANFNGMYIDSFTHSTNSNGTENVKFDVYNTQYIYGLVEIYNASGDLTDVAIIDKMSNSTSIKGVLIDDTGSLIRDIWNGTALTYRQESGYSKKTSINIDIPKGGYIKITNDMSESFIASAINLSDMVFAAKSTFSTLSGFNSETSKDFVYELSLKLINETAFAEAIKTPQKFTDKLWKGVGEELYMNSESVGGFLDTVSKNLDEFADGELAELMISTAANCGIGIAEGTFEALAGPAGVALKAMFTITSVTDVLIEMNDGLDCLYQGSIKIKTA